MLKRKIAAFILASIGGAGSLYLITSSQEAEERAAYSRGCQRVMKELYSGLNLKKIDEKSLKEWCDKKAKENR